MKALEWAVGLTSLHRSLSPKNRSHVTIIGASALASAVSFGAQLASGRDLAGAATAAINAGVMLFLTWAVAREIDPDSPASALLAAIFGALILTAGSAPAGVMVAVLVALRVVVRSTGHPPTILDLASLPVLAGLVSLLPAGWIGGLLMVVALVLDTRLPRTAPLRNLAAAVVVAGATALATLLQGGFVEFVPPGIGEWIVVIAAAVSFAILRRYIPRSKTDREPFTIPAGRLQAGRVLAAAGCIAALVALGGGAVALLAGVWAAFIGVAAHDRMPGTSPEH